MGHYDLVSAAHALILETSRHHWNLLEDIDIFATISLRTIYSFNDNSTLKEQFGDYLTNFVQQVLSSKVAGPIWQPRLSSTGNSYFTNSSIILIGLRGRDISRCRRHLTMHLLIHWARTHPNFNYRQFGLLKTPWLWWKIFIEIIHYTLPV